VSERYNSLRLNILGLSDADMPLGGREGGRRAGEAGTRYRAWESPSESNERLQCSAKVSCTTRDQLHSSHDIPQMGRRCGVQKPGTGY